MKNTFTKITAWIKAHKILATLALVVLVLIGYLSYKHIFAPRVSPTYVLGNVERGTLIVSVSGTGQVSTSNQVDVQPKASGDITSVAVKAGDTVKAGAIIARLDARDALKAVRDAQVSLESTKLANQKALVQTTPTDLADSYNDEFTALANTYLDLPAVIEDIRGILYNGFHSPYLIDQNVRATGGEIAIDYKYDVGKKFDAARARYESDIAKYRTMSRTDNPQNIDAFAKETYDMVNTLADAVKDLHNVIDYVKVRTTATIPPEMTTDLATVTTDASTVSSRASSLSTALASVRSSTKTATTDSLDVRTAQLTLTQKQNALIDAQNQLSDYTVRAPFDGVLAKVDAKVGDTASSGTALATIITNQKVVTLSLNEIDAEKVKVGQKATLTFDAIPDLSISGSVIELDSLGTVSQGVVTYGVKIGLDTQDNRVKSGMSVSATIITDSKPDVLVVPSSAIKSDAQGPYVQIPNKTSSSAPENVPVEIGLSSDTDTEIISGLKENDQIITRTVTAAQTSAAATQRTGTGNTLFGGGANRGAAGATRVLR